LALVFIEELMLDLAEAAAGFNAQHGECPRRFQFLARPFRPRWIRSDFGPLAAE
jgi:hypothetical protein